MKLSLLTQSISIDHRRIREAGSIELEHLVNHIYEQLTYGIAEQLLEKYSDQISSEFIDYTREQRFTFTIYTSAEPEEKASRVHPTDATTWRKNLNLNLI